MGGAVTQALKIVIAGDAKGAVAAINDVTKAGDKLGKSNPRVMGALKKGAVAATATLGAIAGAVKASTDDYKDFGKNVLGVQRMLGGSAEEASALVGAMKMVGGTSFDASSALTIFSKNLGKAQNEGGPVADTMKKLGVELKNADGTMRSGTAVFNDFRNKISQVSDAQERNYYLSTVMGRGFKQLLPLFIKSAEDVDKLNQKVKEMGLVWGGKQLDNFKKLAGAQKEMDMQWLALKVTLAQTFLPALMAVAQWSGKVAAALRPFAPLLKYVAAGCAAYLAVVVPIIKAQKAWRTATTLLSSAQGILGKVLGESTASTGLFRGGLSRVVTALKNARSGSGSLAATLGKGGALALSLSFTTTMILKAVNAWKSYNEAAKQAEAAYQGAMGAYDKNAPKLQAHVDALKKQLAAAQKKGDGAEVERLKRAIKASEDILRNKQGEIERDRYKRPDWYNPLTWFADGGDFIARKPTIIGVGEAGAERVTVTPLGRPGAGAQAMNVYLTVPIYQQGAVIGTADQVGEAIGKLVVPHLRKLARAGAF